MKDNLKKNGRRPLKKMEDDLKKKMETTSKKIKMEDDLKIKNKKMKTTSKKICSQFLLNLGQTFPGIGSAL
jgi:hypothetical protein